MSRAAALLLSLAAAAHGAKFLAPPTGVTQVDEKLTAAEWLQGATHGAQMAKECADALQERSKHATKEFLAHRKSGTKTPGLHAFPEQKLTFGIKTFGRAEKVAVLIKSIRTYYPFAPILIADDGSVSAPPMLQHSAGNSSGGDGGNDPYMCYMLLPWDTGLSFGRNVLVDLTHTPFFAVLDDDMEFDARTDMLALAHSLEQHGQQQQNPGGRGTVLAAVTILDDNHQSKTGVGQLFERVSTAAGHDVLLLVPGSRGSFNVTADAEAQLPNGHGAQQRDLPMECQVCDFVENVFVAETDVLKKVRWSDPLKVGEHEDFFLRLKQAYPEGVALCPTVKVMHHSSKRKEQSSKKTADGKNFAAYRTRAEYYVQTVLKENKLWAIGYVNDGHLRIFPPEGVPEDQAWLEVYPKMKQAYPQLSPNFPNLETYPSLR